MSSSTDALRKYREGLRGTAKYREMREYDWDRVRADPAKHAKRSKTKRIKHARRMEEDSDYKTKVLAGSKRANARLRELPEHERSAKLHKWRLKSSYGLTPEDYEELLASQGNACAICQTKEPGGKRKVFSVDHCHESGKIRGLLCAGCNLGLGKFKDDPELLCSAIAYLKAAEGKPSPEDMLHTVTCSDCGKRWKTRRVRGLVCPECEEKRAQERERRWRLRRTKQCPTCGGGFVDETQANNRKYCSSLCLAKAQAVRRKERDA